MPLAQAADQADAVITSGGVSLGEEVLGEGDAGLCTAPGAIEIAGRSGARVLVLDVAL